MDHVFQHAHLMGERIVALDRLGAQLVGNLVEPRLGGLEFLGQLQIGSLEIVYLRLEIAAFLAAGGGEMRHAGDDEDDRAHHPGGQRRHQTEILEPDRGNGGDHEVGQENENVGRAGHVGPRLWRLSKQAGARDNRIATRA